MKSPRKTGANAAPSAPLAPSAPAVFTHSKQPQWGRAVIAAQQADRASYVFEHGGERTFMDGYASIVETPMEPDERDALAKSLLRGRSSAASPAAKKKKATPRVGKGAATRAEDSPMTFERQLTIFRTTFPAGFADPRFVAEERGTPGGTEKRKDAGVRVARELLAQKPLDAALNRGAFSDVVANAVRVLTAMESLSIPKADRAGVERLPESAHESFARALRDLLHGDGAFADRVGAFAKATSGQPWTIVTALAASFDPGTHFFVKPTMNQRQAKAIGVAEPPVGTPTAAGYTQHLAVAHALREKLIAAGLEPRDLLDVYSFGWRTLTRAAQTTRPLAS
jgi:hypothetical protein